MQKIINVIGVIIEVVKNTVKYLWTAFYGVFLRPVASAVWCAGILLAMQIWPKLQPGPRLYTGLIIVLLILTVINYINYKRR